MTFLNELRLDLEFVASFSSPFRVEDTLGFFSLLCGFSGFLNVVVFFLLIALAAVFAELVWEFSFATISPPFSDCGVDAR